MRALAQRQTRRKPNALVLLLPLPLFVGRSQGRRPGGPIALVGEERPELAGDRRQGLRTQHRDALEPPLERGLLVAPAPPGAPSLGTLRRARPATAFKQVITVWACLFRVRVIVPCGGNGAGASLGTPERVQKVCFAGADLPRVKGLWVRWERAASESAARPE